jgi:hypothetical protein
MFQRKKYGNIKRTVDGIVFDSIREADHYSTLKMMERAGEISGLLCHPRFLIAEAVEYSGEVMRARHYEADFSFTDQATGRMWVQDVKCPITAKDPLYRLKRQLFLSRYGKDIIFTEVY